MNQKKEFSSVKEKKLAKKQSNVPGFSHTLWIRTKNFRTFEDSCLQVCGRGADDESGVLLCDRGRAGSVWLCLRRPHCGRAAQENHHGLDPQHAQQIPETSHTPARCLHRRWGGMWCFSKGEVCCEACSQRREEVKGGLQAKDSTKCCILHPMWTLFGNHFSLNDVQVVSYYGNGVSRKRDRGSVRVLRRLSNSACYLVILTQAILRKTFVLHDSGKNMLNNIICLQKSSVLFLELNLELFLFDRNWRRVSTTRWSLCRSRCWCATRPRWQWTCCASTRTRSVCATPSRSA